MLRQRSIALTSLFLIFTLYYAKHSPPPLHFSLSPSPSVLSSPPLWNPIWAVLHVWIKEENQLDLDSCWSRGCVCVWMCVRAGVRGEGREAIGILILCEKKRVCANTGPACTVKSKAVLMPLSPSCKTGSYLLS